MIFNILYVGFWFIFLTILFLFNKYKLYAREKWKVTISLFIGVNALFTAFVLFQQNSIHEEDVVNSLTERYETISDALYNKPLDTAMKTPSLNYLVKEMFLNESGDNHGKYDDLKFYDKKFLDNLMNVNDIYNSSKNLQARALFLQICQTISVYSQYYYLHLELSEYKHLIISQNTRFINILSGYLKYPDFRRTVQYFINYQAGHRSQKFLKEFFNISSTNPADETEKLIAENKIINGKINGVTPVD